MIRVIEAGGIIKRDGKDILYDITTKSRAKLHLEYGITPIAEGHEDRLIHLVADYKAAIMNDPDSWRNDLVLLAVDVTDIKDKLKYVSSYRSPVHYTNLQVKLSPFPIYTYDQPIPPDKLSIAYYVTLDFPKVQPIDVRLSLS